MKSRLIPDECEIDPVVAFNPMRTISWLCCRLICLKRKGKSPLAAATHWHDGQISKSLSSPFAKNIPLHAQPKSTP